MKNVFVSSVAMMLLATLFCTASHGADNIKERMKKRMPVLSKLKQAGVVGENSGGYLEFVGDKREAESAVNAENADRKSVYQMIAKRQNVSVASVGQRRALKIFDMAAKGIWLKNSAGKWNKK